MSYRNYVNSFGETDTSPRMTEEEFYAKQTEDFRKLRDQREVTYGDYLLVKGYNDRNLYGDADTLAKAKASNFQGRIKNHKNLQANYDELLIKNERVLAAAERLQKYNADVAEVEGFWKPYEADDAINPTLALSPRKGNFEPEQVENYKAWGDYYKSMSAYYKGSARNEWITGMDATKNQGIAIRHKDKTSKNKVYRPNMDSKDGAQYVDLSSWRAGLGIY